MSRTAGGFEVIQPGLLTLVQDAGRFGQHGIGLTTGGPLDGLAFHLANRLCSNPDSCAALEVSVGGLVLRAHQDSQIALCGAAMPLFIDDVEQPSNVTLSVRTGQQLRIGYASTGMRAYLAVCGGFQTEPVFASRATVVREQIGGIDGRRVLAGDWLPCLPLAGQRRFRLPAQALPLPPPSGESLPLRLVPGYQYAAFSTVQRRLFFSSNYRLSEQIDRMGFRLQGRAIDTPFTRMLSEGICLGAVQIPADGQPIILLNDRQTIGGYPKLGAVISADLDRLSQLRPGDEICFEQISIEAAHNLRCLRAAWLARLTLMELN